MPTEMNLGVLFSWKSEQWKQYCTFGRKWNYFQTRNVKPYATFFFFFFFFFRWHYSPLWALACRTMPFQFSLTATNSLHLLTPSTWRSLSSPSFHLFLGLPLLLIPSNSWLKIFLGILSSSILSRWPNQRILRPFIHFTTFSPLLISSSSRFVPLFHSPFSYLAPLHSSKYFPFKN